MIALITITSPSTIDGQGQPRNPITRILSVLIEVVHITGVPACGIDGGVFGDVQVGIAGGTAIRDLRVECDGDVLQAAGAHRDAAAISCLIGSDEAHSDSLADLGVSLADGAVAEGEHAVGIVQR